MTPLIPEFCRVRFSQRLSLAAARSIRYFLAVFLFFVPSLYASAAPPFQSSENPGAKPAPVPGAQQPAAAAGTPSPATSNDPEPLKKAVHQKKVITEDDLVKPAKPLTLSDLEDEENNPACNLSCEAELRRQMGFGPEREAEFRNQLTLARHEIDDDRVWNYNLQSAVQAAAGYCDIQRQVAKIVGKGAVSEYVRNDVLSRFAERQRNFILQYRNSTGLLTQRMQAVQRFAQFRATIMQHQMSEATTRACPDYPLP
jgi:hypothetical protein